MIILLVGKRGVGKTTVADYICSRFGFTKYSFASPMKKALKEIFMFDDNQMYSTEKDEVDERLGITPRKMLQIFGTELFQYDIYQHIPTLAEKIPRRTLWTNRFKWWYERILSDCAVTYEMEGVDKMINVVIDDGRFPHEADAIREMGGFIITLTRDTGLPFMTHLSETEMNKIAPDAIIECADGLFNLYNQIEGFIEGMKGCKFEGERIWNWN